MMLVHRVKAIFKYWRAIMALFVGKHVNKIDSKGRVSVPKPFRVALQLSGFEKFYVYPHFKQTALEACDEKFMLRLSSSLDDLDLFSDEHDDLASVILANAYQLTFDPEGRVILPKILLNHGHLHEDAVFVGQGSRFQIWEPGIFENFSSVAFTRVRDRRATLKLRVSPEVN